VRPAFSWKKIEGASDYQVVVLAARGTFRVAVSRWLAAGEICSVQTCSTTLTSDLQPGSYRWLIRTHGGQCAGKLTPVKLAFTVEPCANPVLEAPDNEALPAGQGPVFTFTDVGGSWYNVIATSITPLGRLLSYYRWYRAADICSSGTCTVQSHRALPNGKAWWLVNTWSRQCGYLMQPVGAEKSFTVQ
jgi:hypothetical protein